jgi:hypothetical protein
MNHLGPFKVCHWKSSQHVLFPRISSYFPHNPKLGMVYCWVYHNASSNVVQLEMNTPIYIYINAKCINLSCLVS